MTDTRLPGDCPNCDGPYLWKSWGLGLIDSFGEVFDVIECRNCRWWSKMEEWECGKT